MSLSIDVVKSLVGKSITDFYGRTLGTIVGFYTDEKNDVTSVEVGLKTGEFRGFSVSQLSFTDNSTVLAPAWKVDANALIKNYIPTSRRLWALEELNGKGEIPPESYSNLHKQYEANLQILEERRHALISTLNDLAGKLDGQIKLLQTLLANIKLYHLAGDLDDQTYATASNLIQIGLDKAQAEKGDIEATVSELNKIPSPTPESSEAKETTEPPAPKPEGETPILVHIEETQS